MFIAVNNHNPSKGAADDVVNESDEYPRLSKRRDLQIGPGHVQGSREAKDEGEKGQKSLKKG
jgi:hypothetical protein